MKNKMFLSEGSEEQLEQFLNDPIIGVVITEKTKEKMRQEFQEQLDTWVTKHNKHLVFVYGTLKRGFGNYYAYLKEAKYLRNDTIKGTMYNLGAFPGVIFKHAISFDGIFPLSVNSFSKNTPLFPNLSLREFWIFSPKGITV